MAKPTAADNLCERLVARGIAGATEGVRQMVHEFMHPERS
jgi:hypothetical protein